MGRTLPDNGHLSDTLVVKDGTIVHNLISIPKFDRLGYTTVFTGGKGTVYDCEGNIIVTAELSSNDLYEFDIRDLYRSRAEQAYLSSFEPPTTLEVLHDRLAHRNKRSIRHAIRKNLIHLPKELAKSTKESSNRLCDACCRAKSTKYPKHRRKNRKLAPSLFTKTSIAEGGPQGMSDRNVNADINSNCSDTDSDNNSDDHLHSHSSSSFSLSPIGKPRDIATAKPVKNDIACIYTDIAGPYVEEGLKGERYYQTFIESDTKYCRIYVYATRDKAYDSLVDLLDTQLQAEGSRLIRYHSDGAKELLSRNIVKLLAEKHCKLTYSPAYTPELNAVVERNHRTLEESAHAILLHSGLPFIFWTYAILYACLIFNHFPTVTEKGYMSPVQAKFGVIPDVSIFRKFGSVCYAHIPAQTRLKHAFADKAYRSYFLGIDTATQFYIVFIVELNEIKITSNVLFDEYAQVPKQHNSPTLEIAKESKNVTDFLYLVGMCYRDKDNKILYAVTRVVVAKNNHIVAYRCPIINDHIGKEEGQPIHVADVENELNIYLLDNPPRVVLPGAVETTVVALQSAVQPSMLQSVKRPSSTEIFESSAKRVRRDQSVDTPSVVDAASEDVLRASRRKEESATPAQDTSVGGHLRRSTRHQRQPELFVPGQPNGIAVGKPEEVTHKVCFTFDHDAYVLYMSDFERDHPDDFALLSHANGTVSSADNLASRAADIEEIKSLVLEHDVWDVLSPSGPVNVVTSKWVRKVKSSGKHKSRLCGRGFNMVKGIDYHETFAPVAKIVSLRILLTLIAIFSLFVGGLDCKTAFLNAVLNEVVWLQPPKELIDYLIEIYKSETDPILRKRLRRQIINLRLGALLRLKKALYGTKQAPREWYLMIDKFLKKHGFVANKADHCFYTLIIDSNNYVFLLLYVDDIIVAATTVELRSKYMKLIAKTFKISYSGELREYLNIRIDHDREKRTVYMSQERYIVEMMEQFDIQPDTKINTPMQENLKVRLQEEENLTPRQVLYVQNFPYRQLVGTILYLNICTRPAISYAISTLAKFNTKPTFTACKALVRVAKYLYNSRTDRLALGGGAKLPHIVSYSDSDWAGCLDTRYSRSGHIVFMGNGPVVWYSKMQSLAAQSTMEAEFIAKAPAIQNVNYCRRILNSTGLPILSVNFASTNWSDNESARIVASNPVHHQRTKHIALKYQYIQDNVRDGVIVCERVKSEDNCSDINTKAVGPHIFLNHYPTCMGYSIIPRSEQRVKSIKDEGLPCPCCSKTLFE